MITDEGLRLDLRVVPPECYGDLLQHFTGSKDHNVALREEAQRRGLSVSEYGVTVVETGEVQTFRDEEALYAFLGYAYIPPELRENGGRARGGAARDAAAARRARRPPRRDALPLDVVGGRQGDDRGDGARRRGPRLRVPLPDRSLALPARGPDRGAVGRRSTRSTRGSSRSGCCAGVEANITADGRRRRPRRGARRSSTGSSPRSTRRSTGARPSACSRRSTTRTSTASAT